jgi:hypothetical protein
VSKPKTEKCFCVAFEQDSEDPDTCACGHVADEHEATFLSPCTVEIRAAIASAQGEKGVER